MKVLVLEDNLHQRNKLIELINKVNCECSPIIASSYGEAKEILVNNSIDAFFVDIGIEGGSGIDFARDVRQISKYKFTPIVFITGERSREYEAFHEIHCYDYITKPYYEKHIVTTLKNILVDYMKTRHIEKFFMIQLKGHMQRISYNDIIYIEKRNRKIYIVTQDEEVEYKCMSLNDVHKELDETFIQVHRSLLVSRNKVRSFNRSLRLIEMSGCSQTIPVGGNFINAIEGIFNECN